MKKYFTTIFLSAFISVCMYAQDENEPVDTLIISPVSDNIAKKIANRMRDSLGLTQQQRKEVYKINRILHKRSEEQFEQNFQDPAVMRQNLQRIENRRDLMYQAVLPPEKYLLYLQKKKNLVNNN